MCVCVVAGAVQSSSARHQMQACACEGVVDACHGRVLLVRVGAPHALCGPVQVHVCTNTLVHIDIRMWVCMGIHVSYLYTADARACLLCKRMHLDVNDGVACRTWTMCMCVSVCMFVFRSLHLYVCDHGMCM